MAIPHIVPLKKLLMAINGSLTVYVLYPNALQHIRTLNLRARDGAAGTLTGAKNITI